MFKMEAKNRQYQSSKLSTSLSKGRRFEKSMVLTKKSLKKTFQRQLAVAESALKEIQGLKIALGIFPKRRRRRKKKNFSISNRIRFQRKMALNPQSSQSLLATAPDDVALSCTICGKGYKREVYLRTHLLKVHGVVPDSQDMEDVNDSVFAPTATSTADDFQQAKDGEDEGTSTSTSKKKQSILPSYEDEDEVENLEEARKAKDARKELRNQLNLERELQLGFDDDELDEALGDGQVPLAGPSTQAINDGLAQTLAEQEETILPDDDSVLKKSWNSNISELTSGRDQAIMDMDVELKNLTKILAIRDTQVTDLRVKVSETNGMMDLKDRKLKEMRDIIKVKNGEIKDLVEEVKSFNDKLKNSPLKEELKANSKKADAKIQQQVARIKKLEAQLKSEANNKRQDMEKLKLQCKEQLTRAEHYFREEVKNLNTIAALRKKIPCNDLPGCDLGKKCAFSHILRYSKNEQDHKQIPCIHFLHGKCKFEREEDCKYAHPKGAKNVTWDVEEDAAVRRQMQDSVSSARSDSVQEISRHSRKTSFTRMAEVARPNYGASGSKPPPNKRSKIVADYDFSGSENSYNSYARDFMAKFPTPGPSEKRKRSVSRGRHVNNNMEVGKVQGNSKGAQGKRSTLEAPQNHSGSRGSQYPIPIHVTNHQHPQPPHHYQHKQRSKSSKSRRSRSQSTRGYYSPQVPRYQARDRSPSRDGYNPRRSFRSSSDRGRRPNW